MDRYNGSPCRGAYRETGAIHLVSGYDDGNELLEEDRCHGVVVITTILVGIGDSFTDKNMAKAVDTIFARDQLAKVSRRYQQAVYTLSRIFFDVMKGCGDRSWMAVSE